MIKTKKSNAFLILFLFVFLCSAVVQAAAVSGEGDLSVITKKVYPSVVKVEAQNHIRKVATGVVIDNKGHIVTTALITPKDEKIFIITSDGTKSKAEFLGMDSETHLAVIRVKEAKLPPIKMGEDKSLSAGSWIGVISISPENTPAVTQGIVSSMGKQSMRLNVYVVPGMSGSPVVDGEGRMIGLLRGTYTDEQPIRFEFRERILTGSGVIFNRATAPSSGLALAVPVNTVRAIAKEIVEKGKVERGWLGVSVSQNEDGPVEITIVEPDSPADKAKLMESDVLVRIEGVELDSPETLVKEIRKRKPGDKVKITVERNGRSLDLDVKLGEYKKENVFKDMEKKFPNLFRSFPEMKFKIPKFEDFRSKSGLWTKFESRKYIGVSLQVLNQDLSDYFGVKDGVGLLIAKVTKDSPAEKAGLKVGDVIISADSQQVETIDDLIDIIQDKEKGEKIVIEYIRDKKKRKQEVEIVQEEEGNNRGVMYRILRDKEKKIDEQEKPPVLTKLFRPFMSIKV